MVPEDCSQVLLKRLNSGRRELVWMLKCAGEPQDQRRKAGY